MQINTATLPWTPTRRLTEPPPEPLPPPTPEPHFRESARSAGRDLFLGAALFGSTPGILPQNAGRLVGGIVGGLGLLSGYGEVREGMREGDLHEVLDGALHMGVSVSLLAVAAVSSPLVGAFLSTGGYTLLAGKMLYDHPKEMVDVLALQPFKLVRDAGKSLWLEFRPDPKPEPQPPENKTPEKEVPQP